MRKWRNNRTEESLASNSGLVSGLSEASRARFSLVEVSQRVGKNTNNRHYVGPGRYTLRVSARDAAEPPAVEVGLAGQWPRAAAEPFVAGAPAQASEGRSRPVARTAPQQGPSIGLQ